MENVICSFPAMYTTPSAKPTVALFMPEHTARVVFSKERLQSLADAATLIAAYYSKTDVAAQLELLEPVDILFTGWFSPRIDAKVLTSAPKLKAVFHTAGSVNPYTSEAFWESGIPISSAYHANSLPVADFTASQIILSLKGFWQKSRSYREARNIPADRKLNPGTRGATIGLVSLGSIARLVIERLAHLDLKLIAYDPYLSAEEAALLGVELVNLETLFATSDVVSCHTPLNDQTVGLLDLSHFIRMPRNSTFINTSRGKIVDSVGLLEALQQRPDLTALLDVTDPEPLPPESAFFDLPNIIVSPHIAGSIGNECFNLGEAMLQEMDRFQRGEALQWQIRQEQALMMT